MRNLTPLVEEIDLSEAFDGPSQVELFREHLKRSNLELTNLLFRGFDASRLSQMLKTGKESPGYLWCFDYKETFEDPSGDTENPVRYALDNFDQSAVAVYDGKLLCPSPVAYRYTPQKGQTRRKALVAVFILKC